MHVFTVKPNHLQTAFLALAISTASLAWTPSTSVKMVQQNTRDTVPPQKSNQQNAENNPDKDIDQRIQQLEKAMQQIERQLQEKNWEKMQHQLESSLSKVDMNKIQQQLDAAIKKVDLDKIKFEADAAIKNIDMEKIRQEIKRAMAEAKDKTNWKELDTELKQALHEAQKSIAETKKIDFEKIKKEIQQAQSNWQKESVEIQKQLQEARKEMKENTVRVQDELSKAKADISQAKDQLQGYKTMISEMESEGLLNTSEDYAIEYKADELFINGKKQHREVAARYKRYFKNEHITIKKVKGNFSINNNTETK
ncbi:MAG: hypothetical protein WKF97_00575 [Chitinophagaceae bacterium]